MTTPEDRLIKIRHQILLTQKYIVDNPGWKMAAEVLEALRKRERELTNQIQVEILKSAVVGNG